MFWTLCAFLAFPLTFPDKASFKEEHELRSPHAPSSGKRQNAKPLHLLFVLTERSAHRGVHPFTVSAVHTSKRGKKNKNNKIIKKTLNLSQTTEQLTSPYPQRPLWF